MAILKGMQIELRQNQLFSPVVATSGSFVASDQDAVRAFLRQLENSPLATERAYKKEIKRFLAWTMASGFPPGETLAKLTVIDIEDYFRFLRSPAPLPKAEQDGGGFWKRPAVLSKASLEHAKTLLNGFFEKLTDYESQPGKSFRTTNPVSAIGRVTTARREVRKPGEFAPIAGNEGEEKYLPEEDVAHILATIDAMPQENERQVTHYRRNRWVFILTYRSWLRLSELARLQMGDFIFERDGVWRLYVHPSKHEPKGRMIEALPGLMEELEVYRMAVGMMRYPIRGERSPAILQIGDKKRQVEPVKTVLATGAIRIEEQPDIRAPLSERAIFDILKTTFQAAAATSKTPWQKKRLSEASPHWLRHSGITHALNAGLDPRFVAAQARHKDLKTTFKVYDHGLPAEQRRIEMDKLALRGFAV